MKPEEQIRLNKVHQQPVEVRLLRGNGRANIKRVSRLHVWYLFHICTSWWCQCMAAEFSEIFLFSSPVHGTFTWIEPVCSWPEATFAQSFPLQPLILWKQASAYRLNNELCFEGYRTHTQAVVMEWLASVVKPRVAPVNPSMTRHSW